MKRVPVEPLSEQRWAKIEKEVFAELDANPAATPALPRAQSSRHWAVGAMSLGVAVALALLAVLGPFGAKDAEFPARVATLDRGERVHLASAELYVAPHSLATLSGDEQHGMQVALARGDLDVTVHAARAQPWFKVHAGQAELSVQAARFHVVVLASATRVEVHEGALVVRDVHGEIRLSAGDTWATPVASAVQPVPAPSAPVVSAPEPAPEHPAVEATPSPRRRPHARANRDSARDAGAEQVSSRELYERAARIEGTRPDEAAAIYFELSQSRDPWAENALFALGRLELERGQHAQGKATLQRYLARHAKGRNADDARRLLSQQK